LLALNAAVQMAPLVGQAGDAPLFSSRAQSISNQFNAAFWTGSAYRSPTNTADTDERGNAMAVLAGLTGPSQAAALRTVLITEQHCSPYMEKYVLEALFTLGYPDDALARMRSRYTAMISSSSTTLWELFPASGGFNHGWSGGPLTLLDEQVAGVTPTAPGFATFDVRPALGTTLSRAGVNVPPPQGLICVLASRNVNNYRLSVRVPPGSAGRVFGLHIRMAITTQAARLRTFVAETPWGRLAPPWETPRGPSAPPWEKCGRGDGFSCNGLSERSASEGIRAT
jgi:hypothetical protein